MIPDKPMFSIITPTLNASATLEDAVCSAIGQGVEYEHLIMDGCSSDRTLEIAQSFPHLTVHSGRDRGLYDAMNRGAFFARGEWLIFLQADDWLPEGTLLALRDAIRNNPAAEIISGSAEAVRQVGDELWENQWARTSESDKTLTFENIALGEPMINARAIRKTLFKKIGPFQLVYSLASDRDFLLKLVKTVPNALTIEKLTYRYRWHEGSRTMNAGNGLSRKLTTENLAIAEAHLRENAGNSTACAIFKTWHARQSTQAGLCALEAFDFPWFIGTCLRATKVTPYWAFGFLGEFSMAFLGFVKRGFKTRSQIQFESQS